MLGLSDNRKSKRGDFRLAGVYAWGTCDRNLAFMGGGGTWGSNPSIPALLTLIRKIPWPKGFLCWRKPVGLFASYAGWTATSVSYSHLVSRPSVAPSQHRGKALPEPKAGLKRHRFVASAL